MSERSVAPPARTGTPRPTTLELMAERIELEVARLKEARPELVGRIDRAVTILVVHLSSAPRTRPIRCRIRRGGRKVLLVSSLSAGGAVYEVDPRNWSCSCPDFHRAEATACKHGLSGWILLRVGLLAAPARRPCDGCGLRFKPGDLVELNEDNHDNLSRFHGDMLCRECADAAGVMR